MGFSSYQTLAEDGGTKCLIAPEPETIDSPRELISIKANLAIQVEDAIYPMASEVLNSSSTKADLATQAADTEVHNISLKIHVTNLLQL